MTHPEIKKSISVTTSRTMRFEIDNDTTANIVRTAIGAPVDAHVELSEFGDTIVTWTTVEEKP